MASSLLDVVARLSVTVLYVAAFGLAFGEAAFLLDIVVPGEVGLVVAGAAGERRGALLPVLCLLGATGAVLGDSVSWWIGHRFGTRLVQRWSWTERTIGPQLERARDTLSRRGGIAIFGARWIGALRALVPMVAGAAGVPYRTLLLWDAPAALLWGTTAVCLGWYLGEPVADTVDRLGGWISIVVVGVLAVVFLVRHRRRRRR